jgi:antitoxin (DNA-binding transcriptional repressor) of toxin-antitoxin stability system
MNDTIGLKDLRENLGNYERLIKAGHSFVVMKRSKPIFTIGPVEDADWETVIDFTKFRKGGITAQELLKTLKNI